MSQGATPRASGQRVRIGLLAIGALAALAVVCAAGSAPAAAQSGGQNVTVEFVNGSDEAPVVNASAGTVAFELGTAEGWRYDAENLTPLFWETGDHVADERSTIASDLRSATYELGSLDVGPPLEFSVTVLAPDGSRYTDSIQLEVQYEDPSAHAPEPSLTFFDDPTVDVVEVGEDERVVNFSAFGSSDPDPEEERGNLSYHWQVSSSASGDLVAISEFNGSDYDSDFFAQYHATEADVGEQIAVRLTVFDSTGLHASETMNLRIGEPEGTGGAGVFPPRPSPPPGVIGTPSFDVGFEELPSVVPPGASVTATIRLENDGDGHGHADLGLALGDADPSTERIPLPSGESTTLNVSFAAPPAPGEYAITVQTQDGSQTRSMTVVPPENDGGGDVGGQQQTPDPDESAADSDGDDSLGWVGTLVEGVGDRVREVGDGLGDVGDRVGAVGDRVGDVDVRVDTVGGGVGETKLAPMFATVFGIALFGVFARRLFG